MPETIYQIDPATGELLSIFEGQDIPGATYIGPQFAPFPPPAAESGKARVFQGGAWHQVDDHRGQIVYGGADDRELITITALGPKADFGTDTPAPLTPEEQAAAVAEARAEKLTAARAEQQRRQESSFVHEGYQVKAGQGDLEAMARFGGLIDGSASSNLAWTGKSPWDPKSQWFAFEPGYDPVLLPTRRAAQALKMAMLRHGETYTARLAALSQAIFVAADKTALEAINVSADHHWQG